jgi:alpha-amylase
MRLAWIAIALIITSSSCKLMPKKDKEEMKTKNAKPMNKKTVDWAHTTNIYEVNLRQFTSEGTINAFAASLPRLKEMGVQTLWFMPITPIAKKNM